MGSRGIIRDKKILALILARSGSKILPNKNTKPFCGKPLIAWTIEAALKSRYVDRTVVSTDSVEIVGVAKDFGSEAPFVRPDGLAADDSKTIDVVLHAVDWMKKNDRAAYDLILMLQPTSPLRLTKDIDAAIELLFSKSAKAVVSVCENEHPVDWINTLPKDNCMRDFLIPGSINKNRQELSVFYRLNGAIYLAYPEYIKEQGSYFGDRTFAYIMPKERSVDIDDAFDFKMAEWLMNARKEGVKHDG